MEELRLVGFEDGSILLENLQGNNYRLPVDEQLKSAVRSATQHTQVSQSISPREIQDRIRLGATVEELVAISGAEPEYINKFAQPVFDELAHMVETALAIRITIAGDRFNDDVQVPFGQLVEQRLVAAGATKLRWSSKRGEGISWMLSCNYTLNGHEGLAMWLYEPRKYQLSPENETAVTLSNHNNTIDGPIPKLRTIEGAAPATSSSLASPKHQPLSVKKRKSQRPPKRRPQRISLTNYANAAKKPPRHLNQKLSNLNLKLQLSPPLSKS